MARIRTIKPDFWTSDQIMSLSRNARLTFIGLWNFCDDEGRHKWSARQVKAEVFPGDDDIDAALVADWLGELERGGLVKRYRNGGDELLAVTGWHKHQRIDKRQKPKFAGPDDERSETVPGMVQPDRNGKERIGREDRTARSQANGRMRYPDDYPPGFVEIREEYPQRAGSDPNPAAVRALRSLLESEDGWSVARVRTAVEAYRQYCDRSGIAGTEKVMQLCSFLGPQKQGYLEDWQRAAKSARPRGGAAIEANNQQAARDFASED